MVLSILIVHVHVYIRTVCVLYRGHALVLMVLNVCTYSTSVFVVQKVAVLSLNGFQCLYIESVSGYVCAVQKACIGFGL